MKKNALSVAMLHFLQMYLLWSAGLQGYKLMCRGLDKEYLW